MAGIADLLDTLGRSVRVLGLVTIGLGLVAMLAPTLGGASVMITVGLLLLAGGGVRAVFGWHAWSAGKGPLGVGVGALTALVGLALVVNPVSSLGTVTLLVAVYLAIDGLSEALFALQLRPEEGWPLVLGNAVLSVLLGAVIWTGWPVAGVRALGLVVGVKLLAVGAMLVRMERTMGAFRARAAGLRARIGRA